MTILDILEEWKKDERPGGLDIDWEKCCEHLSQRDRLIEALEVALEYPLEDAASGNERTRRIEHILSEGRDGVDE